MNELTRRPLGRSDLSITTVGFGSWAASGMHGAFRWGEQDDRETIAAIHRAAERGVSWIDTAPAYGFGHAESVVGQALAELPPADRPLVFTKCGRRRIPDDPNRLQTDLRPESIRAEVEESLRRLRADALDLLQIHWPPPDGSRPVIEEAWGTLTRLRDEGRARFIGVCNFDVDQLGIAEAIGHVDSLQPRLSLVHPDAAAQLIPWCADNGTGVIVYSPMASGLLTERMSVERLAGMRDDWRSGHPDFQSPRLERNLALRDALLPIAERHGVQTGAIAVAWTLAQRGVTGAIVGARSANQVDGWLPAATIDLSAAELAEIEAARAPTDGVL
jgi:aryl-alcohol dehydrogenase-like predicted oxidoreductase